MAEEREKRVDLPWGNREMYSCNDQGSINGWICMGGGTGGWTV